MSVDVCMKAFALVMDGETLGLKRRDGILAKHDEEIWNKIHDDDIVDEIEACEKVHVSIDKKVSEIDVILSFSRNVKPNMEQSSGVQSPQDTAEMKLPRFQVLNFGGIQKNILLSGMQIRLQLAHY